MTDEEKKEKKKAYMREWFRKKALEKNGGKEKSAFSKELMADFGITMLNRVKLAHEAGDDVDDISLKTGLDVKYVNEILSKI